MKDRKTSKKAASAAGKVLGDKSSNPKEKSAAASALSQAARDGNPNLAEFTLLADHVREFVASGGTDINLWLITFRNDLERIEEKK